MAELKCGDVTAHVASAGEGAPAVVVVHDRYGLLPHVRTVCDTVAAAGISAAAVDLYGGRSTTDDAQAEQLLEHLDPAAARRQVVAAVQDLRRAGAMAPRVFGLGYSTGGTVVLRLAHQGLFDGAVAYDASLGVDDVPMPCPVQLHVAEHADVEPADLPARFVQAVRSAGGAAEAYTYPRARRCFANADTASYDPAAARQALQRTLSFLRGGPV